MDGRVLLDLLNAVLGVVGTLYQLMVSWWSERPSREWHRTVLPLAGLGTVQILAVVIGLVLVFQRQALGNGNGTDMGAGTGSGTGENPGRIVTDDGRAFGIGGSSRFSVAIDPANSGIRVTRRLDAGIGDQNASVTVNGTRIGEWRPLPATPMNSWEDQTVYIPDVLTAGRRRLTFVNKFISSSQDFNEFTYFVDQQVNGVWRRADTVDVGPYSPAAETGHRYRITGQTWSGVRRFHYAK
jgi:hypothetical protein